MTGTDGHYAVLHMPNWVPEACARVVRLELGVVMPVADVHAALRTHAAAVKLCDEMNYRAWTAAVRRGETSV